MIVENVFYERLRFYSEGGFCEALEVLWTEKIPSGMDAREDDGGLSV